MLAVKGDEVQEGVIIHDILPDAVMLSYKNQIFHINISTSPKTQTLLADSSDTASQPTIKYIPHVRKPLRLPTHYHLHTR